MGHFLRLLGADEIAPFPFPSGEGDAVLNAENGLADIIKQLLQLAIYNSKACTCSPCFSVRKEVNHWNCGLVRGQWNHHPDFKGFSI